MCFLFFPVLFFFMPLKASIWCVWCLVLPGSACMQTWKKPAVLVPLFFGAGEIRLLRKLPQDPEVSEDMQPRSAGSLVFRNALLLFIGRDKAMAKTVLRWRKIGRVNTMHKLINHQESMTPKQTWHFSKGWNFLAAGYSKAQKKIITMVHFCPFSKTLTSRLFKMLLF